jgi:hypothetical protein
MRSSLTVQWVGDSQRYQERSGQVRSGLVRSGLVRSNQRVTHDAACTPLGLTASRTVLYLYFAIEKALVL